MKKLSAACSVLLALVLSPAFLNAQYNWDFGTNLGASNYLGEMGGNQLTRRDFVSDMKLSQTHMTAGAFAGYRFRPAFAVRGSLNWARISGNDRLSSNPGRNGRNLSFRNDLFEATAQVQYLFFRVNDIGGSFRYTNNLRMYVAAGAGAVLHNPKTFYEGQWVALRPLETEGVHYSAVTAVIPVSGGFYFTFNRHYRIGWDITWRKTFTDYLDDASTRYPDPSQLKSPLAAALSNRTGELSHIDPAFAENYTPGSKRGDPTHKDSYVTTSLDFSYVIRGHSVYWRPQDPWVHHGPSKWGTIETGPPRYIHRKRRVVF